MLARTREKLAAGAPQALDPEDACKSTPELALLDNFEDEADDVMGSLFPHEPVED